jgi:hypothetical protein
VEEVEEEEVKGKEEEEEEEGEEGEEEGEEEEEVEGEGEARGICTWGDPSTAFPAMRLDPAVLSGVTVTRGDAREGWDSISRASGEARSVGGVELATERREVGESRYA